MNYLLTGASRGTHLKIVGVALVCSLIFGLAFNASLFAASKEQPQLVEVKFAPQPEYISVCRVVERSPSI